MENKALNKLEAAAEKLISSRDTKIAELQKSIEKESADISTANNAMEEATAAGDVVAYRKAKENRQSAADAKEMHEKMLNNLKKNPLISKEEYEEMVSSVFTEMNSVNDHARAELAELSEKMAAISADIKESEQRANTLLQTLQNTIYRGHDRRRDEKGEIMWHFPMDDKKLDFGATYIWGMTGVNHHQYELTTGKKTNRNGYAFGKGGCQV